MGGTMWVESEMGVGTTFHFTIRAEAVPDQTYRYLHEVQPQLNDKRVLIVDDNATNRRILTLQAKSWGMVPTATALPIEALDWIRRGDPFDVAILDMQMPEMDGVTLATQIQQERNPRTLPLVMLTSLGRREAEVDSGAVEFAAFLTKPIKPSQLFDVLVGIFAGQPTRIRRREPTEESLFDAHMGQRLPLRILLAEDNVTNQKLALRLLERLGYRADVVANGLEVLEALERQSYDLVLMDVQMPEMDGLEATRHIRRQWPGEQGPHIIAMTANAMQGDRELCLEAGMDDYVSKPIRVDELVSALSKARPIEGRLKSEPVRSEDTVRSQGSNGAEVKGNGELMEHERIKNSESKNPNILEPTALANLRKTVGDDPAFVAELIDTFLDDAPQLLADLRQALEQGDAAKLRLTAHSLKSNSAEFGALTFSGLCQELEALGKAGTLAGAADLVSQLEEVYEKVRLALEMVRTNKSD
jgi:CheY-like chemotaxis protein